MVKRKKAIHKESMHQMLLSHAKAKKAKAELTLQLMCNLPAGIGDHSTDDFYNNAIEAMESLTDANDQLETIHNYFSND